MCPTENQLLAFVDRQLAADEAEAILVHADGCGSCMALLAELLRPHGEAPRPPGEPPEQFEEYRVVRLLGAGAMGRVYLGRDTLLDRDVAIKFLAAAPADDAARDRFLVEARAVARVQHPNVVAIHRVGVVDERPYLVTELVPGTTLRELAKPVPPARARRIAVGLARGLAEAHRRGVLHRDIKPANAMLTPDDEVKLVDFGLATVDPVATGGPRAIVGTPRYMAPEVQRGEPATERSDVYSLGAVLDELAGAADAPFAAVIARCRAAAPADRYADGGAVLAALEALPRRRQTQIVALAGVAAALVAGAFVWVRARPSPAVAAFVGEYRAAWHSTVTFDEPAGAPAIEYDDTAVITVTAVDRDHVEMAWRVGSNNPSGTAIFAVAGDAAHATGTATGGSCWSGTLANGNTQTTCGTTATAVLDGDALAQPQTGTMRGVTPDGVAYAGTYRGTWTGTRVRKP